MIKFTGTLSEKIQSTLKRRYLKDYKTISIKLFKPEIEIPMRELRFNLAKVESSSSTENIEYLTSKSLKNHQLKNLMMWKEIFIETNIVIRLV